MVMANLVKGVIGTIIAIIVVFLIIGNTAGDISTASDNISGSGLPLASLFGSSGVVLLIFMAFVLLAIFGVASKMGGNK